MMAGTALYGISLGINNPVLPLFGMRTLNRTPAEYGVLMAMFPLGGLSATLFSPLLAKHLRAETLTCGALFLLGLTNFAYALSRGDLLPPLTMYLSGVCFSLYATALGPVLQTHVPVGYMARISSLSNPVLAVCSLLATAAVSCVLVHVNADDSPIDAPTAALVLSAAVLLSGAGLLLKSLKSSAPVSRLKTVGSSAITPSTTIRVPRPQGCAPSGCVDFIHGRRRGNRQRAPLMPCKTCRICSPDEERPLCTP